MKVSYEYNWLIKELTEELNDGIINEDTILKIVRDRRDMVIDWFYSDDKTNEPTGGTSAKCCDISPLQLFEPG